MSNRDIRAYKPFILWSFIYIVSGLVVDYIVTKLGLYESKAILYSPYLLF